MKLLYSLCFALLAFSASAKPNKSGTCASLKEKDIEQGMGGKNTDLGFQILTSKTTIQPREKIRVSISGPTSFKGLLFYVIDSNKNRYAGWSTLPQGYQFLNDDCRNFGPDGTHISHNSPSEKRNFTLEWTAPEQAVGNMIFAGVVATGKTQWQVLKQLELKGSGTAPASTLSASSPSASSTGSSSSGSGSGSSSGSGNPSNGNNVAHSTIVTSVAILAGIRYAL
jgi:hypothetical protein